MRHMIVLLMAGALMVMVGAAPASAQVIIEPGLADPILQAHPPVIREVSAQTPSFFEQHTHVLQL